MFVATSGSPQTPWFAPSPQAIFQTGDSFAERGSVYRLYGVQSCLRSTRFTNAHGQMRDCGEASLAMLAALMRDLRPRCMATSRSPDGTTFVVCVAQPQTGAAAGSRIDLGTALISLGYAFASMKPDGTPVHPAYLVAQRVAQSRKTGLWAFADVPDPNVIIAQTLAEVGATAAPVAAPRH